MAQATTPRSLAHRVARERLLRDKERTLLRMQTATLRRALFCSHYISVLKGVLGAAVAIVGWGEPVFSVRREDVWPVGRWLSMPHASEWESGAVAPLPWLAISAAASARARERSPRAQEGAVANDTRECNMVRRHPATSRPRTARGDSS